MGIVVITARIREWRFRVKGREYRRYAIIIPKEVAELLESGRLYRITIEPVEGR